VVYDLINVIHDEAKLNQALIKDKQCDNLFVLAASQTRDKEALTQDGVERVLTSWPRWASSTSSATRRPASRPAR
jgi:septum site-determining protein MinD